MQLQVQRTSLFQTLIENCPIFTTPKVCYSCVVFIDNIYIFVRKIIITKAEKKERKPEKKERKLPVGTPAVLFF